MTKFNNLLIKLPKSKGFQIKISTAIEFNNLTYEAINNNYFL